MVCDPTVAGLYVTAQLLSPAVAVAARVQVGELKLPLPRGRITTLKLTVPLGLVTSAGTVSVSWTVAVQVLVPPVGTLAGLQFTMVLVGWIVALSSNAPLEPECVASPA